MILKLYVSYTLHDFEPDRATEERYMMDELSKSALSLGFVPISRHHESSPISNSAMTPQGDYTVTGISIRAADAMLVNLNHQSLEVGLELGMAAAAHIPIIGFCNDATKLPHIVFGVPGIVILSKYQDQYGLISEITKKLREIVQIKNCVSAFTDTEAVS